MKRKPFTGVLNIIKFNWHFYVLALLVIAVSFLLFIFSTTSFVTIISIWSCILVFASTIISLAVSFYVYDVSNLYSLNWLNFINNNTTKTIANIHAGFDEITNSLKNKFPDALVRSFDFYDPKINTEISIKRARKLFPSSSTSINSSYVPVVDNSIDLTVVFMSVHEIRNAAQREIFFNQLRRIIHTKGEIVIVEHLRNLPNFIAFNFGFFHFYSNKCWTNHFKIAGLRVQHKQNITPFVTLYCLNKS